MSINVRQKSWIFTLSLAFLAIAYLKFVWLPGRHAIQNMVDQLDAKRAFITESTTQKPNRVDVDQALAKADAILNQWKKLSPSKRDIPQLYGRLNAYASECQLETGRFDPQPVIAYEKLRELPVSIACTGTFEHLYEYLRKVESLPAVVWIDTMKIDKQSQDGKDVHCEISMVVFSDKL